MMNQRDFLDSHAVKPGELTVYSFEEWGHWIVERMTQEGKNFEMKKGVYQFRGFILEGDSEVEWSLVVVVVILRIVLPVTIKVKWLILNYHCITKMI